MRRISYFISYSEFVSDHPTVSQKVEFIKHVREQKMLYPNISLLYFSINIECCKNRILRFMNERISFTSFSVYFSFTYNK